MKYTDEQLSRILSAAAVGGLVSRGNSFTSGLPCCIEQAAYSTTHACSAADLDPTNKMTRWARIDWFDRRSTRSQRSDPDAMLRALEEKGWA